MKPKDDPFLINRDGEWADAPAIVRKSDGAATYATTDLATLEYRLNEWAPDVILYVTDSRQAHHFRQVFEAYNRWKPAGALLMHAGFGMILGEDKTPFKTREGGVVKLTDLLDEAEARARNIAREVSPAMSEDRLEEVGRVLGHRRRQIRRFEQQPRLGLRFFVGQSRRPQRQQRGLFGIRLCAHPLDCAPRRRAGFERGRSDSDYVLGEPAEVELAKVLARFGEAIDAVLEEFRPHLLCDYLYELAGKFAAFYRDCPILKDPAPPLEVQLSRLALTQLAGDVLARGLGLLGIETVEAM